MSQVRLLKRISHWQQGQKTSVSRDAWEEQLLLDIESLLNSQQGNVLIDERLGLSDLQSQFQSHSAPNLDELEQQIRFQIQEFEPRVQNITLNLDEDYKDPTSFCWKFAGAVVAGLGGSSVHANIKILANGQVTVEAAV